MILSPSIRNPGRARPASWSEWSLDFAPLMHLHSATTMQVVWVCARPKERADLRSPEVLTQKDRASRDGAVALGAAGRRRGGHRPRTRAGRLPACQRLLRRLPRASSASFRDVPAVLRAASPRAKCACRLPGAAPARASAAPASCPRPDRRFPIGAVSTRRAAMPPLMAREWLEADDSTPNTSAVGPAAPPP